MKTSRYILPIFIVFTTLALSAPSVRAATIQSAASGAWNSTTTWVGGTVPGLGDAAVIQTGHTVTVTANAVVGGVTVNAGGFLEFDAGFTLTFGGVAPGCLINGTVTIPSSGGLVRVGTGANRNITVSSGALINDAGGNFPTGGVTVNAGANWHYNGGSQTMRGVYTALNNLTLSGTGTKTLGAHLTLGGKLSLQGTATFAAGGFTLTYGSGATLEYKGSASQSTGAEILPTVPNLIINNPFGVAFNASTTVTGELTLESGLAMMGENTLTLGSSGVFKGGSPASHVDGRFAHVYNSIATKEFPIGKGGNYRPLTIEFTALDAPATVVARQLELPLPGTPPAGVTPFNGRHWQVTQTGASNFVYNITLDGTGFSPLGLAKILQEDSEIQTAHDATVSGNSYTASGLTGFSGFGLGSVSAHTISGSITDGVNPVEGISVSATGGHTQTVLTNSLGVFTFTNVLAGAENILITPTTPGYTFDPEDRTVVGPVTEDVEDQDFTATIDVYTITASAGPNGSIDPVGAVSITHGADTTFTFEPDEGYHVDSVFVNGEYVGSDASYTFVNVQGDSTIHVTFAINVYTITATAGPNGSIVPAGAVSITHGADTTFTFEPDEGYHVDSVFVNGEYVGSDASYTFVNVQGDSTIHVTFAINVYTITASAGSNGSIDPSGEISITHGADTTFTFEPNEGYHVDSVFVNGEYVGSATSYTFVNVQGDSTIHVTFAINVYTITATAGPNGSIDPSGEISITHGADTTFTFEPDEGYLVDSVFVNGEYVGSDASYTFVNVQGDSTIHVTFAINVYTITATAGPNGSIDPSGEISITHGADTTFTFEPDEGYHVDSVFVNGEYVGSATSYTFVNVQGDSTIHVTFALNTYSISGTVDDGTDPLSAVTVTATGGFSGFAMTGASGEYTITGVPHGTVGITLTPSKDGYTFDPDSRLIDGPVTDDITDQDFTGTLNSYSISGTVDDGTDPLQGVTVTATGGFSGFAITGASGGYTITGVPHGTIGITLTPSKDGYTFAPPSRGVDGPVVANITGQDFTGTLNTYTISGTVVDGSNPLQGVTVMATGGFSGFAITGASGGYTITGVPHGTIGITLTPSKDGYTFAPPSRGVDGPVVANITDQDFTGTLNTYTISGTVLDIFSSPVEGVEVAASGGFDGSDATDPLGVFTIENVPHGTVAIVLTPSKPGYVFFPETRTVDGPVSGNVTGEDFSATPVYTISVTVVGNGTIEPSGDVIVPHGESQSFTITPDEGHHIDDVEVDGASVGPVTEYTFTNVTANHSLHAVFAVNVYTITATAGPNGTISPSGNIPALHGSNQSFTITPNVGYHILDVLVNGTSVGPVSSYTFENVRGDSAIHATFAINEYTITATAGPNGSIHPEGNIIVTHGSTQLFTFTPEPGYHVADVEINGNSRGPMPSYTFINIRGDSSIHVSFAINVYTITATAGPNGSITPSGEISVNHGASQMFTIAPEVGHHIDDVEVDGVSVGAVAEYTFTNVTEDHSIHATFAVNMYTLNVFVVGSGSVVKNPDEPAYPHGALVELTAIADPGHIFVGWSGDASGLENPLLVTMDDNKTITAHFSVAHTITATAGPNGSIVPEGIIVLAQGSNQTFTFFPNVGYHVGAVYVNGQFIGSPPSYIFENIQGDSSIHVTFAINEYTLVLSVGGSGTGTATKHPDQPSYTHGTSVLLSASPGVGSSFAGWTGDASGPTNPLTIVMDADKNITAMFTLNVYTISATAGPNGTISPSGNIPALHGSNQSFTITPNVGYHILDVLVNGTSVGPVSSYTFENVRGDSAIHATFAINEYTITATAGPNGSIHPEGNIIVTHGSTQLFTFTPEPGYHVADVEINGNSRGPMPSYTFINIRGDSSIHVSFAINVYTITATAGPNGTITPSGTILLEHGENQLFTIAPNTGYDIADVLVDGISVGPVTSYEFVNVTASHTIHASFVIRTYTITATAGPNGSIAPTGAVVVEHGASQTFTITPAFGFQVENVMVDDIFVGPVTSYTFPSVTRDYTIHATFIAGVHTLTVTTVGGGSVTKDPDLGSYPHGSAVLLTAVPDEGNSFTGWSGSVSSSENPLTVVVTAPMSITAHFSGPKHYFSVIADSFTILKRSGRFIEPVRRGRGYPNWTNFLQEVVVRGGFRPFESSESDQAGGMVVGVSDMVLQGGRWRPTSDRIRGWVRLSIWDPVNQVGRKFQQIRRTLLDRNPYRMHSGTPRGLDYRDILNGRRRIYITREYRILPPNEHDNILFSEQIALKLNIAASDLGITPSGFGELIVNIPSHPMHGKTLRQLSAAVDSALTYWEGRSPSYFAELNEVVALVNRAFLGPIDTLSFAGPELLKLAGSPTSIAAVPFLLEGGGTPPFLPPLGTWEDDDDEFEDEEWDEMEGTPIAAKLYQNYPNPFNPSTTISFNLRNDSYVTLKIFNVLGQEVMTLLNGEELEEGYQTVEFRADRLASGVYFYHLHVEDVDGELDRTVVTKKMLLLR